MLKVLVVDDEPLIRWSLAETLGARGYHVIEAADACSALTAASEAWPARPFDVVLLDLVLPDCRDLSLLARLRALAPDVPVIVMTAFATGEVSARALELGAYHVVSKPFDPTDLAVLVAEAHESGLG